MTEASSKTRSVIIEREFPHPPERIWRALTQPRLIEEWLMKNDFQPVLGHRFDLRGDWGSVACKVLGIEPNRTLVYSWEGNGLKSVVTWTLVPSGAGTSLRMEQSGFETGQEQFYQGAQAGWPRFLAALEQVVARVG
ncbi:MAG: SRPBCC domain-containing protein [Alphaproteobacteria bacterium]|nr:SRPBCC domain-containing protein [Alphaproteobacteria bacterium]